MYVIKRNGEKEQFDIKKIYNAVNSAFKSVNKKAPYKLLLTIKEIFEELCGDTIGVEEIQDKVETILMNEKFFDVAKSYIIYREKHKEDRMLNDRLSYMMNYINSDNNAAKS